MNVRFHCRCGRELEARTDQLARHVTCPDCGTETSVPDAPDAIRFSADPDKPATPPPLPQWHANAWTPGGAPMPWMPGGAPMPWTPPPRPPASKAPWIIGMAVAALFVALFVIVKRQGASSVTPIPLDDTADKYRESLSAFGPESVSEAPPETVAQITAFVDEWTASVKSNSPGFMDHYDIPRLADEGIGRAGVNMPFGGRKAFVKGFNESFRKQSLGAMGVEGVTSVQVRKVRMVRDQEAVVYVRLHDAGGPFSKERWWVRRSGNRWRIFDKESLELGLRLSVVIGSMMQQGLRGGNKVPAWVHQINGFQQVGDAMQAGDIPAARTALNGMQGVVFPDQIEAVRLTMTAIVLVQEGKYDEALAETDRSLRLQGDQPWLHLIRGIAFNFKGSFAEALPEIDRCIGALGPDENAMIAKGVALIGLDRRKEAADSFRDALRDNPGSVDALEHLADALPDEDGGEIGEWFAKMPKPADAFAHVAENIIEQGRGVALESVLAQMRKIAPGDKRIEEFAAAGKRFVKPDPKAEDKPKPATKSTKTNPAPKPNERKPPGR